MGKSFFFHHGPQQPARPDHGPAGEGAELGAWGVAPVSWHERLLVWLLSLGPVPRSVGVIPDGNRRFARKRGVTVDQGHVAGSHALGRVGTWCSLAGVKESIVYVFSVDNFQRPRSEQDGLFREVSRRCQYILDNSDNFRKMGRRVRCVGDLEMLPKDLQRSLAKVDLATADNVRTVTVACVAYSSRRQVTRMARRLAQAVKEGQLRSDDITTNLVDDYASLEDGARVQLLLRTSGETRLSDFLLWQSSYARLHFECKNLPEIGFTDYLWALIEYQLQRPQLQAASHASGAATGTSVDRSLRQRSFLKRVEVERSANLERLARL
nr:dehydrodolichyl diphosphate synthase complex subunit DHDDS-like [Dermacentor andersoni]XP_054929323.1 dehydrodolichyl diphosphate synthase complex subunit DHDDS-like [Dermacentor andersoni]